MSERGIDYLTGPSKRWLDIIGSLAISGALSPVAGGVAVVSGIDTRSNPIFKQSRIGRGGQEFNLLKFRTLAESRVKGDSQTYGTIDPRATIAGLAIRKLGLDEIPQLVNVIRGEMSLVGLRPLILSDVEWLHDLEPKIFADWYNVYQATRPGVTGPGQIYRKLQHSQDDNAWIKAMRLDLEYSEKASLLGDINILANTPVQLLKGQLR